MIVYGGAGRSKEGLMLARHGYGVLLLVPRGQGASEGDIVRWAGDTDLLAGAEYLQGRADVDDARVGAIGFSVGGEQLLEAAARSTAIRAVVSEGAGGRVGETDDSGVLEPLVDLSMLVMTTATSVFQNHGPHPRPEERIGLIAPRPVFLIYAVPGIGEEDIRQPQFMPLRASPRPCGGFRARSTRAASRRSPPSTSDGSSRFSTTLCWGRRDGFYAPSPRVRTRSRD